MQSFVQPATIAFLTISQLDRSTKSMSLVAVRRLAYRCADALLRSAIDQARPRGARNAAPHAVSVLVHVIVVRQTMVVHVIPVHGSALDIFAAAAAIIVAATVYRSPVPKTTVVRGLLDLTSAEARVASQMIGGSSLAEIAVRSGTSAKVRSQLTSVFAKTGRTLQTPREPKLAWFRRCLGARALGIKFEKLNGPARDGAPRTAPFGHDQRIWTLALGAVPSSENADQPPMPGWSIVLASGVPSVAMG